MRETTWKRAHRASIIGFTDRRTDVRSRGLAGSGDGLVRPNVLFERIAPHRKIGNGNAGYGKGFAKQRPNTTEKEVKDRKCHSFFEWISLSGGAL